MSEADRILEDSNNPKRTPEPNLKYRPVACSASAEAGSTSNSAGNGTMMYSRLPQESLIEVSENSVSLPTQTTDAPPEKCPVSDMPLVAHLLRIGDASSNETVIYLGIMRELGKDVADYYAKAFGWQVDFDTLREYGVN